MAPIPTQRPKRLLGTSLKLYFDLPSTIRYIDAVASLSDLSKTSNIDLFVIPDFLTILPAQSKLKETSVMLGAQDTWSEDKGAFTGEVSPVSLAQAGVKIVEVGHAERRKLFGETDEQVGKKCEAVVRNGMIPLICIGEKSPPGSGAASAAVGKAVEECRPQVDAALKNLPKEAEVVLAYEPVWAIGAEKPAQADHVVGVAQGLRRMVEGRGGENGVRILYGGSAGPGTFEALKEGVDGLFLGRFAHDTGNLKKVIEEMAS